MKKWTNEKYTTIAVYVILVILASLLFLLAVLRLGEIGQFLYNILFAAKSIVFAVVIALALFPLCHNLEGWLSRRLSRKKPHPRLARFLSVLLAYLILILIISLVVVSMLPMGSQDYEELQSTLTGYVDQAVEAIQKNEILFNLIKTQTGLIASEHTDSPYGDTLTYTPPETAIAGVLEAPSITISPSGLAEWKAIDGAARYRVRIGGAEARETTETSVQLSDRQSIAVQAVSDTDGVVSGPFSAIKVYLASAKSEPAAALPTPYVTIGADGMAVWPSVPYAGEYRYRINDGEEQTTVATSVQLAPGDTIVVMAVAGTMQPAELLNSIVTRYSGVFNEIAAGVGNVVLSIISSVSDILIALILSVYFLLSRDMIQAAIRKVAVAVIPARPLRWGSSLCTCFYTNFMEFASARLLCSFTLGALCYLPMWAFQVKFYPLLSLVVFFLNIIPVIGPIVAGALVTLMVLLVQPNAAWFVLLVIIVLNLLEQYLIEHYLLPKRLRPSPALVIIIELIAYHYTGLFGVILAIPLYATLRKEVGQLLDRLLHKKGLPTAEESYIEPGIPEPAGGAPAPDAVPAGNDEIPAPDAGPQGAEEIPAPDAGPSDDADHPA